MNLSRSSAFCVLLLASCSNSISEDVASSEIEVATKTEEQSPLPSFPAHGFRGDTRHYSQNLAFNAASPRAIQRRQVVWLSTAGLTLSKGDYAFSNAQDDTSPILEIESARFPPLRRASFATAQLPASEVDAALVSSVQRHFDRYAIDIVTERPRDGNYTTVIVGGTPEAMGIENPNLLGIAPFDPQNQNVNDIVFVFSQSAAEGRYDLDGLAVTIVHELGHSFGLDHVENETNIMAESICRCLQEFGSGPVVGNTEGRIQNAHTLLSSVFLPRENVAPVVSCEDNRLPSIATLGSVLNEEEGCVNLSGQPRYWRSVSDAAAGDGHYLWTGAIVRDSPVNAATFSMRFQSSGRYDLDAFIPPVAEASAQALYRIQHRTGINDVRIDQRNQSGYVALGRYEFEAGQTYTLVIGDNSGEPSSASKRVLVDSIRVLPFSPVTEEPTPQEPSCEDEGHHSFATARDLGDAADAQRCASQDDYYRFEGDPNCSYVLELEHQAEVGNLDLSVFSAEEQALARAESNNSVERVIQGGTGEMFVRVSGDDAGDTPYRLTRRAFCRDNASCPADDVYEPNDDAARATRLFSDDVAIGMTCNNEDVFRLASDEGCETEVRVEFLHAKGDIDIEVRDENGTRLANGVSVSDDETLRFQSQRDVFLRVYGYQAAQNDYRVRITQDCLP